MVCKTRNATAKTLIIVITVYKPFTAVLKVPITLILFFKSILCLQKNGVGDAGDGIALLI